MWLALGTTLPVRSAVERPRRAVPVAGDDRGSGRGEAGAPRATGRGAGCLPRRSVGPARVRRGRPGSAVPGRERRRRRRPRSGHGRARRDSRRDPRDRRARARAVDPTRELRDLGAAGSSFGHGVGPRSGRERRRLREPHRGAPVVVGRGGVGGCGGGGGRPGGGGLDLQDARDRRREAAVAIGRRGHDTAAGRARDRGRELSRAGVPLREPPSHRRRRGARGAARSEIDY